MKKTLALLPLFIIAFLGSVLRGATQPETRTILVFPFENLSPRPDLNWISEGFAEVLSSRLSGPNRYVLGRGERTAACGAIGMPPEAPLTLASEYKVAETLGVDWAVVGNFAVEGNRLTARAQLLEMRQLKLKPPIQATGELTDLADIQARLSWRLLATEDPSFITGTEESFEHRFPDIRLDAFENYVRGVLATDAKARIHFLTEADRLNPGDHSAAFELGRYYFDQKDYGNSAKWLHKLVQADADYLEALFLLGVDDYFLGRETEAEKAFLLLSQQIPLNEVWNNLGVMQSRRGRYAEALPDFEHAYQADPNDPDFCLNLAVCLWYLKKYQDAAKYLRQAVRNDDNDPATHALLAVVSGKLGDAAGRKREVAWLEEHEGASMANVGEDILPQTRLEKHYDGRAFRLLALAVRNALEATIAPLPPEQHGDIHLTRGQKLIAAGRLAEAERELTEAVSLLPQSADAHLSLGQVYELENRHQDAAAELETSLKLKETAPGHVWLARVYVSLNRPQAALDQGEAALSINPGDRYTESLLHQIREHPPNAQDGKR
jgi:tetratricopeptide (TPR) repeat protein